MKTIQATGTRKRAVARATLRSGTGNVKINKVDINAYGEALTRDRIREALILAGNTMKKVDIDVNVFGGGKSRQADAIRVAIANGLAAVDEKLKPVFLEYDRQMFVPDVRYKEATKPNCNGKARAKRQKSYR
jgi:small subunit ribosomal protein S9